MSSFARRDASAATFTARRYGREINRMLGKLAPGDVVTVTPIDRLARSTFDLFGIVKRIVDAKAQFRSLAEPWADTGTSTGRLMLAVLGGLADVECDLILTRTAEGRIRAKAEGKLMGRPPALTLEQQKEAIRRRAQGPTLQELARSYAVGISTIQRATRAYPALTWPTRRAQKFARLLILCAGVSCLQQIVNIGV
jgi:DNA invertase Pin-like site-specific DNA recombinase